MRKRILRTLSIDVTPLTYLFSMQGVVWGIAFVFLQDFAGVRNTILYQESVIMGKSIWGMTVLAASIALLGGLFVRGGADIAAVGALVMAVCWIFAAVTYITGGYWFLLALAIIYVLMYSYLYLAASMGLLWHDG